MEKYVKLTTSKERITTAVFVVPVIAILLYASSLHLEYNPAYAPLMGGCLFFIGLSIAVKIETKGWVSVLWNGLLIVLAVALSYMSINLLMEKIGSPRNNPAFFYTQEYIIGFLVCLFLYLIFLVFTARPRLTLIIGSIFWFIFGMVAYSVYTFRGELFLFPDIFAFKTAMDVAGNYQLSLTGNMIIATLILVTIIFCSFNATLKIPNYKKSISIRVVSLILCGTMIVTFWTTDSEKYYYSFNGAANEYLYAFAVSAKMLYPVAPKGYNPDTIDTYMENPVHTADADSESIPTMTSAAATKPNVIAIMNESFSDPAVLGNFETNIDYMPFIHSLEENTIKGNTYVSVFGGGTCDSEYSFLTNNTTAYLPSNVRPYQQYIKNNTPGLVNTLKSQEYDALAIHPGFPEAWNRNTVYPYLGFDQFIDVYQFSDASKTRNTWISDISCYERIISEFENHNLYTEDPQFIFNVTIANHGDYNIDSSDLEKVTINNHEGEFPKTEQYLSLMLESDRAFEKLVNYFSYQDEPTIILMFGDHQANIEDAFYEFLKGGKPLEEWSVEELQQRYVTPFVLWANYDIPEMAIDKLSVNYLAPLLLKTAGLETTPYDEYLLNLAKELPVINSVGLIDKEYHHYKKGESTPYDDELLEYQQILYNNIIDNKNRTNNLYYIE